MCSPPRRKPAGGAPRRTAGDSRRRAVEHPGCGAALGLHRRLRGPVPPETRFLNGETIGELIGRVLPSIQRLLADDDWDTVLVVLHAA